MFSVSYLQMFLGISALWLVVRGFFWIRDKQFRPGREAALLLVFICIVVVVRFTFCPFGKVDGKIQPLLFDSTKILPFWLNLKPFVYLFDYPTKGEALLNLIGNTAMFLPLGIVWPAVFKELDRPWKVMAAGAGFSLCIELLQLPFYDRATDIDDLILNTLGFAAGYGIYLLTCFFVKKSRRKKPGTTPDESRKISV